MIGNRGASACAHVELHGGGTPQDTLCSGLLKLYNAINLRSLDLFHCNIQGYCTWPQAHHSCYASRQPSSPQADDAAIPVNGGPLMKSAVLPLKLHSLAALLSSRITPAASLILCHP